MSHYPITPLGKPRMTQRDKWQKRPAVMRYRAFADECRLRQVMVPECGSHIVFTLPMPASWSAKKKAAMTGQAHRQKPDADNLLKALMDAVLKDDSGVWDCRITKLWGTSGGITISEAA